MEQVCAQHNTCSAAGAHLVWLSSLQWGLVKPGHVCQHLPLPPDRLYYQRLQRKLKLCGHKLLLIDALCCAVLCCVVRICAVSHSSSKEETPRCDSKRFARRWITHHQGRGLREGRTLQSPVSTRESDTSTKGFSPGRNIRHTAAPTESGWVLPCAALSPRQHPRLRWNRPQSKKALTLLSCYYCCPGAVQRFQRVGAKTGCPIADGFCTYSTTGTKKYTITIIYEYLEC